MTINSLANVPPSFKEETFDTKQYLRANVYVPRGTLDAYIASLWGNFANLHDTLDPSAVNLVENDGIEIRVVDGNIVVEGIAGGAVVEVYNAGGQLVYSGDATSIPVQGHGVYIVRTCGKVLKVML